MASQLKETSSDSSQPLPRRAHCAASVGGKLFLWGGRTKDFNVAELASEIHWFDSLLEDWESGKATGDLPPGVHSGALASSGEQLFHYGGLDEKDHEQSTLSGFTPATSNWTLLSNNSVDGPMAKYGCGMVCCGEVLCVLAGHGLPTGPIQPGSTFIKSTYYNDGSGWTNELHFFNTKEGVWSSPAITGTRPSPRSNFTLTAINNHQAVGFAGGNSEQGHLNDTFLIDFQKMEWTKLDIKGELPVPRESHAACCLNFGEDHPQLLVTGGVDRNYKVLDDAWILDVHARIWRMVDLPRETPPRACHSLTALPLGEGVTEAVTFGGYCKWPEDDTSDANYDPIADTTVMCFESRPPSADGPSKWNLTDIANNSQRGSKERVTAKKAMVGELCMRHHRKTATLQPQATSPSDESHTLRETQRALHDSRERERVLEQRAQEAERRLQEAEEVSLQLQQFADASERRERQATTRAHQCETRAQEATTRVRQCETRAQETEERHRQEVEQANQRAHTAEARVQEVAETLRNVRAEADRRLQEANQRTQVAQANSSSWVVQHAEVQYTHDPELGRGGWAAVKVAKFRGLQVAAKCPYKEIISDYNRQMFVREMNMAARVRHPNLLQFIGATLEGSMVILTELMPTSLRDLFRLGRLPQEHITSISLDVARALNYLHLMRPDPIVHRDISSANVLLEPGPNNSWKAKVSDYGSVNLQRQLRTTGAGSPVYAAPEASTPGQQSPKMDIFSFGVLLIETCTAQFPEVSERETHIQSIPYAHFVALIRRCLDVNRNNRPSASDLITELSQ